MNSASEFERALRAQIETNFIKQMPAGFMNMRVREFCGFVAAQKLDNFSLSETPKTTTRLRSSNRQQNSVVKSSASRKLFPQSSNPNSLSNSNSNSTPSSSKYSLQPPSTPQFSHPQTPHHITIKSSVMKSTQQRTLQRRNNGAHQLLSKTPSKQSARKQQQKENFESSADPNTGIVQFQLNDGNFIDVDFSRSPKSALEQANLLGSEAIGEVKAKIETYANQFMQYLKFFKKFKPSK
jgi:hypothetical protein